MKYIIVLSALFFFSFSKPHPKVLIFTKTMGYHHASIPDGVKAVQQLGMEHGFDTDTTSNSELFNANNLKKYKAIVFVSTTGDLFNEEQKAALINYMKSGGGYVGIHAAADAEYKWPWYNQLVGAWFESHPKQQQATIRVVDANDRSTKHLPTEWVRTDEWYNFKNIQPDLHVLLTIDESTYEGGKNGAMHPMAWYHKVENGRSFYTELGHTTESYSDPKYLNHLLGGIEYAIGK
jgi:type 1 glutamine amidotransferase